MIEKLKKGNVFWYRIKKSVYGGIVIEIQNDSENDLYLILISAQLDSIPSKTEHILLAESYTLAWFSKYFLLPSCRYHVIDNIKIFGSFKNSFGLTIKSNGSYMCNNVGQFVTWKHTFRSYSFHDELIKDILCNRLRVITD